MSLQVLGRTLHICLKNPDWTSKLEEEMSLERSGLGLPVSTSSTLLGEDTEVTADYDMEGDVDDYSAEGDEIPQHLQPVSGSGSGTSPASTPRTSPCPSPTIPEMPLPTLPSRPSRAASRTATVQQEQPQQNASEFQQVSAHKESSQTLEPKRPPPPRPAVPPSRPAPPQRPPPPSGRLQPPPQATMNSASTGTGVASRPSIPPRAGVISAPANVPIKLPIGAQQSEPQSKPPELLKGPLLLPEPLKPKIATPLPLQPPPLGSQKLQEPLKPAGLKPISQTPPPSLGLDHLAPQAPPRSKSAQNLPVEPVAAEQLKASINGFNNGGPSNIDPFADLSLDRLADPWTKTPLSSGNTSLQPAYAHVSPTLCQQQSIEPLVSSQANCMPLVPPIPPRSKSQESFQVCPGSLNFLADGNTSNTNPFTRKTGYNPFRTDTQNPIQRPAASQTSVQTSSSYPVFSTTGAGIGEAASSSNPFKGNNIFQSKPAISNKVQTSGWVTFEDNDFSQKDGTLSTSAKEIECQDPWNDSVHNSSLQNAHKLFPSSDFGFGSDWHKSNKATGASVPMPSRRPPPPIPLRSNVVIPILPFNSETPDSLTKQDFTER